MVHQCVITIGGDVAAYIGSVLVDVYVALFGSSSTETCRSYLHRCTVHFVKSFNKHTN